MAIFFFFFFFVGLWMKIEDIVFPLCNRGMIIIFLFSSISGDNHIKRLHLLLRWSVLALLGISSTLLVFRWIPFLFVRPRSCYFSHLSDIMTLLFRGVNILVFFFLIISFCKTVDIFFFLKKKKKKKKTVLTRKIFLFVFYPLQVPSSFCGIFYFVTAKKKKKKFPIDF